MVSESRFSRQIVALYSVLITAAFFVWPVSLGIPAGSHRIVWMTLAFILILTSILSAWKFSLHASLPPVSRSTIPWTAILPFAALAFVVAARMPLTFFGDEDTIALPALTLVHAMSSALGWPLLILVSLLSIVVIALTVCFLDRTGSVVLLLLAAVFGAVIAVTVPMTSTLAIRYPPLMHFVQTASFLLAGGDVSLLRLPNILWWLVTAFFVWRLAPQWTGLQKFLFWLTLGLTPLGWTYRILLYQVPGELAFASVVLLLVASLHRTPAHGRSGLWLGIAFALWIITRPTAFALLLLTAGILFILRAFKPAREMLVIAFPIGLLWCSVYLFGSFQYSFLDPHTGRSFALSSVIDPMRHTILQVPLEIGWVGVGVLLLGGLWIFTYEKHGRILLAWAWAFALGNTVLHEVLTIDRWYGYGRFNAFLLLPLAATVALIAGAKPLRSIRPMIATLLAVALVAATPWNLSAFLEQYRALPPAEVERSVTGGLLPSPLPDIVHDLLRVHEKNLVILAPSLSFLDLFIAEKLITPAERSAIIDRSRSWTIKSSARPVLIVPPSPGTSFLQSLSPADHTKLTDAAAWARRQKGVEVIRYGAQEVLVVR